ncbi:MAG: lipid-A-disaccharide synthase [Betaproteobacteria bacterium]
MSVAARDFAEVTIGIVAGEASGDALGSDLIRAVQVRLPRARFVGIGGPRMEAAGCVLWYAHTELALRGYAEVITHLPALLRIRGDVFRRLRAAKAPLFIGIDAPDFNLGLEAKLKRRRIRTIHYVSPSVWAWRRERIGRMARSVDHLLALFPFEPPLYADAGIGVTFVGHPLAAGAATAATRREARELLKLEMGVPVFALLPGSRMSELEMHTELLLKTAAAVFDAQPQARFVVPLISRDAREYFERVQYRLELESLSLNLLYGHAAEALRAADVGIVASGTATLEAAMARCPHLVFYRVHPVTAQIVKRRLLLPFVGLPNILAGRFVAPEFLQWGATADNLSRAALNLYDDAVTRRRTEALFSSLADALTADGATIAAEVVMTELRTAGVRC